MSASAWACDTEPVLAAVVTLFSSRGEEALALRHVTDRLKHWTALNSVQRFPAIISLGTAKPLRALYLTGSAVWCVGPWIVNNASFPEAQGGTFLFELFVRVGSTEMDPSTLAWQRPLPCVNTSHPFHSTEHQALQEVRPPSQSKCA